MTTRADVIDGLMLKAKKLCAELSIEPPYLLEAYLAGWHSQKWGMDFVWRRVEFAIRYGRTLDDVDQYLRERRAQQILARKPAQADPCDVSAPRANVRWNTCLGQFRVQVGHEHDLIAEVFYEWIV
jgi:hypothetical protein